MGRKQEHNSQHYFLVVTDRSYHHNTESILPLRGFRRCRCNFEDLLRISALQTRTALKDPRERQTMFSKTCKPLRRTGIEERVYSHFDQTFTNHPSLSENVDSIFDADFAVLKKEISRSLKK